MLISIRTNTDTIQDAKKVKGHLEAASVHHIKAASYLKEGQYEKAAQNAILAQEYLDRASEAMRVDMQYEA